MEPMVQTMVPRGVGNGVEGCGQWCQGVQTMESRVQTLVPRVVGNGVEGCRQWCRGVRTTEPRGADNGVEGADSGAEGCGQRSWVRTTESRGADNGVEGCGKRPTGRPGAWIHVINIFREEGLACVQTRALPGGMGTVHSGPVATVTAEGASPACRSVCQSVDTAT